MTSVMPQGVEHSSRFTRTGLGLGVMTSVMPQGVEHLQDGPCAASSRSVMTSVMPQGVEHKLTARAAKPDPTYGDDLRDAARR